MRFTDLYIRPDNTIEALNMISYAKRMKIGMIGIDLRSDIDLDKVTEYAGKLGIRIIYRYDVEGKRRSEIAKLLRRAPRNAIVTIIPQSIDAARYAAVNKRVHMIRIPLGMEKIADKSTAKLFRDRGWGAIEVVLHYLLGSQRNNKWKHYYVTLRRAYSYNINVVLSSGARNIHEMWHPYQMAGIASLAGVPGEHAITWVSSVPAYITQITH